MNQHLSSLQIRDLERVWHPATHFRDLSQAPPIPIASAKDRHLTTSDGQRMFDAISSWWTCVHGHGRPEIVEAVSRQIAELDHVMFAGFTHEPAVRLAEMICEHAPPGYGKVFYSDCGSAAIEVALKLSFQSRIQTGEPSRRKFAALEHSYHGETLGSLALCGNAAYRETFAPLLAPALYLPVPARAEHRHRDLATPTSGNDDSKLLDLARQRLDAHAHELTALVIEPLVLCAGSMRMPGVGYYRELVRHAQSLGIHVIADEIAVAFGRTGKLFATSWTDVSPDLLCASKGLSGGVLPLACTLVRSGFESAFEGEPTRSFLHSHSFTANPIACAAGLANLELFQSDEMGRCRQRLIDDLDRARERLEANCPWVRSSRQAGTIVAFELGDRRHPNKPAAAEIPQGRLSLAVRCAAKERGLLLRPLHDTLYWMPPLTTTSQEVEWLEETTAKSLDDVFAST